MLNSIRNFRYYVPKGQSDYFAKIEFISTVSRFYMYFEDDKYEQRTECVLAVFNPIKEREIWEDDDWTDYRDYIYFSLDANNMPYLKNAYIYNFFLASDRSLLKEATIFWIEDNAKAEYIIFESEFLCVLVDKLFKLVAIVEFHVSDTEAKQKEQYIKSGELVALTEDEKQAALAGVINKPTKALFKLLYQLKNIDLYHVLTYGLHNNIITGAFISDFIVYLKSTNYRWLELEKELSKNIPFQECNVQPSVDVKYENIWVFLKLIHDIHQDGYIDLDEYVDLLSLPHIAQDYSLYEIEKQFELISSFKHIDVWQLIYFGLNRCRLSNKCYVDFAVYLMLKGDTSSFTIELAGINNYEIEKAEELMEKQMQHGEKTMHNDELILNKLWQAVKFIEMLVDSNVI